MEKRRAIKSAAPPVEPEYFGQHLRNIDGGRLIVPADWRSKDPNAIFVVSLWPIETREYVLVMPHACWVNYTQKVKNLALPADQAAMIERSLALSASKRTIDAYGRLLLPEIALNLFASSQEVVLVGRLQTFEIWEPDKLENLNHEIKQETRQLFNSVRL